jgi:hypothetical protein
MSRTSIMDDPGDIAAPPGSKPWAVAVCLDIQTTLNDINGDAQHLRVMVNLCREHKGHRQLVNRRGKPYATFEEFCTTPQPWGLGYSKDDIDAIIAERHERQSPEKRAEEAKPLKPNGGNRKGKESVLYDNTDSPKSARQGTSAPYLTARIARDRPDILERMKAGEFKSVRAAALELHPARARERSTGRKSSDNIRPNASPRTRARTLNEVRIFSLNSYSHQGK